MRTYYQEVHNYKVAIADLTTQGYCVCLMLVRKTPDLWKKTHATSAQPQYTFEVYKTEEIFDFLVKEKFITFPENYKAPTKEELKGKEYYKYHDSYNHSTNNCWTFKNVV